MSSPLSHAHSGLLGTSPIPFLSSKPPQPGGPTHSISSSVKQGSFQSSSFNYGGSPIATYSIYGTSPPPTGSFRGTNERQPHNYNAAKKFYSRLLYDTSLDSPGYLVGVVERVEQPGGLRMTERLVEHPFLEFHARHHQGDLTTSHSQGESKSSYSRSDDVPYHRIAYFKCKGLIAWESELYIKQRKLASDGGGPTCDPSSLRGSSPIRGSSSITPKPSYTDYLSPKTSQDPSSTPGGQRQGKGQGQGQGQGQRQGQGQGQGGTSVERFSSRSFLLGGSSDEGEEDQEGEGSDEDDAAGMFKMDDEGPRQQNGLGDEGLPRGRGGSGSGSRQQKGLGGQEAEGSPSLTLPEDEEGEEGVEEAEEEEEEVRELPEQCWRQILDGLETRSVCMMGRVNKWLKDLSMCPKLWQELYFRIFAEQPGSLVNQGAVRRLCRRSEIRAARWLESEIDQQQVGYHDTMCLQLDESKVVSGDGSSVRVWSHVTGRRIATLKGHTGRVNSLAYDENLVVSGCSLGAIRFWGMDDLKCSRNVRVAHEGSVNGVALLNGIPVSAGSDGSVRLWDVNTGLPILTLESPRHGAIQGLEVHPPSGYIVACGDGVQIYDASAAQLLHDLRLPEYLSHLDPSIRERRVLPHVPLLNPPQQPQGWEEEEEEEEEEGGEVAEAQVGGGGANLNPAGSFRCVAYSGSVLAAACRSSVVLWDPRCNDPIGVIRSSSLRPLSSHDHPHPWQCVALQLDDWKLLAAFNTQDCFGGAGEGAGGGRTSRGGGSGGFWGSGGGGTIALYDMRATPALGRMALESPRGRPGERDAWQKPLMQLEAPGRIYSMRSHGQTLIAGLGQGQDCASWSFKAPTMGRKDLALGQEVGSSSGAMMGPGFAAACAIASSPGRNQEGGSPGAGEWLGTSPGAEEKKKKGGGKKVRASVAKQQNRFPKRK